MCRFAHRVKGNRSLQMVFKLKSDRIHFRQVDVLERYTQLTLRIRKQMNNGLSEQSKSLGKNREGDHDTLSAHRYCSRWG